MPTTPSNIHIQLAALRAAADTGRWKPEEDRGMNPRAFAKDSRALTRFLKAMLWILVGTTVLSLASDMLQMQLLNSGSLNMMEAEANDTRQRVVGIIYLLAYAVTGVTFLKWIHRVNLNVRGFGAQNLQFTPGWSIGYYFIPFLNLVRPYRAMKEIWQASKNPDEWSSQSVSPILGWWWALFLISGFLGQTSFRLSMQANSIETLSISTIVSIVSGLLDIPLSLVALTLVTKVFRMQEQLVGRSI